MEDGELGAAEASSSTVSEGQRREELIEFPLDERESRPPLLPSSDSPENINVPSESRANSGSSASYTSVIGNNYRIFLSFRGPDTRKGFVDHLYHRLAEEGLHHSYSVFGQDEVFKDDEKLRFGEPLDENLLSAIERSKISIPVISENYASSEWCLRELIHIMECKESREQKVYPVLYKVTTGDVGSMQGKFGDAFRCHKHKFDKEVKKKGREALKNVVRDRVFELDNMYSGYEGKLVKALVEIILQEQQLNLPPSLPKDLVGIEDHVARVMNLVDTRTMRSTNSASSETQIIVIYGIGGIGKTTLATAIYKKLSENFKCRSFCKGIREIIKSKGIKHVQSQLLSDLTKNSDHRVHDFGIEMIRSLCQDKKVLLLLDDVDCQAHLDDLIEKDIFYPGSRIIITCRDSALLKHEYKGYELKEMNNKDSLLLFSKYAGEQPSTEFLDLYRDIVFTTGGLPLALVIIGSFLKNKEKSMWTETLEKLRKVPHRDVQQKLRISYDSLEYEEQQMFLDIACFFIGMDKRIVTYLWKDLQYCLDSGFGRMIELSLVKIDDNNELTMHDQLRDLGKAIAHPVDKKPWECSRLWGEEARTIQRSKDENRNIEALCLDKNGSIMFLKRQNFGRMPYLKFLHLSEVDFDKDFGDSFSELRWLECEMCSIPFNAANIDLEKLLVLDLSWSSISENWEGWSTIQMERLKVLNLSRCSMLKSTPNLSRFKSLEMLILGYCTNLERCHSSIGDLECLVSLNLRYCGTLKDLPEELGKLRKLEELLIDETDICSIPTCIEFLTELKMLSAVGCGKLTQVPRSISHLVNLSTLNLNTCRKLHELPDSIQACRKLQRLLLVGCYKLKEIPSSIGEMGELVELDLSYTVIEELHESIGKLKKLKILRVSYSKIKKLPSAIGKLESLQELDASGCYELAGEIVVDKGGLSYLRTLRLGGASISRLPENFQELSTLEHLDLLHCSKLESLATPPSCLSSLQLTCLNDTLPSLSHLSHLEELSLHCCISLRSIPALPLGIRKLQVWKCPILESFSNPFPDTEPKTLDGLIHLRELEFLQCKGLKRLDGLKALTSLRKLDVSTDTKPPNLDNYEALDRLTHLDMQSYGTEEEDLQEIPDLGQLKFLEVLSISARKRISQLDLSKSEHLQELIINNCLSLKEIRFHDKVKTLVRFESDGCQPQITGLFSATGHLMVLNSRGKEEQKAD